jgi:hypothetical protein
VNDVGTVPKTVLQARRADVRSAGKAPWTTTMAAVTAKKQPESSTEEVAAKELVRAAREQGLSPTGPDGLLKQFTKNVLETPLNEEATEHLGHEKNRPEDGRDSTNVGNGTRPKAVLTEATGQAQLDLRFVGRAGGPVSVVGRE